VRASDDLCENLIPTSRGYERAASGNVSRLAPGFRFCCNPPIDLFPMDGDFRRAGETEFYAVSPDLDDRHLDIVPDDDTLTSLAA